MDKEKNIFYCLSDIKRISNSMIIILKKKIGNGSIDCRWLVTGRLRIVRWSLIEHSLSYENKLSQKALILQ